jgi:hypothetical protein
MRENGFTVKLEDADDFAAVKEQRGVPAELQSCHTAIVDGYVVEGHVPADDVKRMLAERPKIVGIAVAGMPVGSPGMEVEGAQPEAYEVIAFDKDGTQSVYASYKP